MSSCSALSFKRTSRRGATTVFAAFCLVIVMMMAAFAVDLGYIMVAKADLQRAADAAAQSAVIDYRKDGSLNHVFTSVRQSAQAGVEANPILRDQATVDLNMYNADMDGDIVLGRIDFDRPRAPMTYDSPSEFNAVRVTVRRSLTKNGSVPLFFGKIFGYQYFELQAAGTAAIIRNVSGFKIPPNGENVPFLPITISESEWENQMDSKAHDHWSYDSEHQEIVAQFDGIPEVVLFPNDTGSAGNFGTVNIGTSNNSTSGLGNQIRNGLDQADLDVHGGQLQLDNNSSLTLSGNPGLSAGIKDDLASITGEVRIIPVYDDVSGTGSNASFEIVRFEAVRVMAVHLSSGNKYIAVQPARLSFRGVVQSPSTGSSSRIYSPPVIVQ